MSRDFYGDAVEYAQSVVSGIRPAGKYIVLAARQFLEGLERQDDDDYEYYFDVDAAEKPCEFIELMPHTKGKWAAKGLKLTLEPWQCFFVCNVFGWLRKEDGLRRYRRAELFVPRKNGKSALAAAIGLYLAFADGEFGSEVYSGAQTEAQAWEVFGPAKLMVDRTPEMIEHFGLDSRAKSISKKEDNSRIQTMIGKPRDGASPHGSIIDEYHEADSDHMVDAMETGAGAREQPLVLIITTAGDNLGGPCYKMQVAAQKMLEGKLDDPYTFALIYGIDVEDHDNWSTHESFVKANPNYGVSIYKDYYKRRVTDALNDSSKQGTYKTKQLNVWVGAREAYFDSNTWIQLADESLRLEDFAGEEAYIGVDLATKIDIAAVSIIIPRPGGRFVRFSRCYVPEARAALPELSQYAGWVKDGRLIATEGNVIDLPRIRDDIKDLCKLLRVREMAYDPYQATMLAIELSSEGVPVVEVGATVGNFSEPMKEWDKLIRARKVSHDGDPVYTWMLGNTVAKSDAKENVYPRKEKAESKIDSVVADLMALNRCLLNPEPEFGDAIDDPIRGSLD